MERWQLWEMVGRGPHALILACLLLAGGCVSQPDGYHPSYVPEGTDLVMTSDTGLEADGRRWQVSVRADAERLYRWLRDWKRSNEGETFVMWIPGNTPSVRVVQFWDMLGAAGIEDYKILKGREVH